MFWSKNFMYKYSPMQLVAAAYTKTHLKNPVTWKIHQARVTSWWLQNWISKIFCFPWARYELNKWENEQEKEREQVESDSWELTSSIFDASSQR